MKTKIFILLVVFSFIKLQAQNGVVSYSITTPPYSTQQNTLDRSAFVIDNNGNKWIGFNSGTAQSFQLVRFNGTAWDTFPHIPNKVVNALAVDASNNVWIASNGGLVQYNGSTFTTYDTSNSNIVSNNVISLACGGGNVYIGTKSGLSVFNGSTFTNYNHANNNMYSDTLYSIAYENASTIWLGCQKGLEKFNGNTFTFQNIVNGQGYDVVWCIYIDQANNKWLGTNAHGVIKYDNSSFKTMEQLYPMQTTIGDAAWPITCKSICKGPTGGAAFYCPVITLGVHILGSPGLVEINNTQLSYYHNVGSGGQPPTTSFSYVIFQYDNTSNKLFWITLTTGLPNHFLYSFDVSQYSNSYSAVEDISNNNSAFLDINNASALITDNSNMHWDNISGQTRYFLPKNSNSSPLHTSALWIGGYHNSTLRVAAMTYRQNGVDFWPGPVDPQTASITATTSQAYDKVWKVNRFDIANFQYNWNAGTIQNGTFYPSAAIMNWPGNSPYNGTMLAPYVDYNHDGHYNFLDGDYPLIKGDQMIWSVYNDVLNTHTETTSKENLGIEIQASAYAFVCPNTADSNVVLNNTTFYSYNIINRSQDRIDSTRFSVWEDADLGNYQDDYIGSDVMNNFGYIYNGDSYDEDAGSLTGYHHSLPVFACNILSGPLANANDGIDNDNNGVIDEPNEKCLMHNCTYFNNSGNSLNGNPGQTGMGIQYYNLMKAWWEVGGTQQTFGGVGTNSVSAIHPAYRFVYPGTSDPYGIGLGGSIANPVTIPPVFGNTAWTEKTSSNMPGDRRFQVGVGPFTMLPGGSYQLDYALVFSQDSATCAGDTLSSDPNFSNPCIINRSVQDNKRVRNWFNNNSYPGCLSLNGVGIKQYTNPELDLKLYPNPANDNVFIEFASAQKNITIEVYDMLGKLIRGAQYSEAGKYVSIPVSDLSNGVYIVRIKSGATLSIKKFVKE